MIIVMNNKDLSSLTYQTSSSWLIDMELLEDHFYCDGQKIDYERVKKISSSGFLTIGGYAPVEISFDIFLDSNKILHQEMKQSSRAKDTLTFGYGGKGEEVFDELSAIFDTLSTKTFPYRVEKYERIYKDKNLWWLGDERGYDIYLSERGKVYKNDEFWEYAHKLDFYSTSPGDLVLKKKSSSVLSNLKNQFVKDDIERLVILTNVDSDIRNYILVEKLHFEIGSQSTF